jgi:hypothetical protein
MPPGKNQSSAAIGQQGSPPKPIHWIAQLLHHPANKSIYFCIINSVFAASLSVLCSSFKIPFFGQQAFLRH